MDVINTTLNLTSQQSIQSISLPFLGEITLMGGIVGLVFFVIGYFIGSSLKSGIKFAFIFLLFILALYMMGIIGKDVILKLSEGFSVLKEFSSSFSSGFGMGSGAFNFQLAMFLIGLIVGIWRG
jgi:hypothetical protein